MPCRSFFDLFFGHNQEGRKGIRKVLNDKKSCSRYGWRYFFRGKGRKAQNSFISLIHHTFAEQKKGNEAWEWYLNSNRRQKIGRPYVKRQTHYSALPFQSNQKRGIHQSIIKQIQREQNFERVHLTHAIFLIIECNVVDYSIVWKITNFQTATLVTGID